jgi:uncharacterized damage-inducible protein DinB
MPGDYAPFYHGYVMQIAADENDAVQLLEASVPALEAWLQSIPAHKQEYAYAEGKWTMKQMLQHIIDTERVFSYRAMCIARGEQQPLPGFDENAFAAAATASHRSWAQLVQEMMTLRQSSVLLYQSLLPADLERAGTASESRITCNALAYLLVGHVRHHMQVYAQRYA